MLGLGTTLCTNILENGQCELPSVLHAKMPMKGLMDSQREAVLCAAGCARWEGTAGYVLDGVFSSSSELQVCSRRPFAASRLLHSHARAEAEVAANSLLLQGLQEEMPFPPKPLLKHVSPLLCGASSLYPLPLASSFVGFGISRGPSAPPSKHLLVIKMQLRIVHFAWYIIIPR